MQLGTHEQNRFAGAPRRAQLIVNEFDRANVHTARGLRGKQHAEISGHFACDDDLLLVAATQRASRRERIGGSDVERLDAFFGERERACAVDAAAAGELFLSAEDQVVGDGVVEHEAARMAVFGDVRDAVRESFADRRSG